MTSADASERALDFVSARFRESVKLISVDALPFPIYGFNTARWHLFAVTNSIDLRQSATRFVAVHEDTGEVRDLGQIG